MTKKNHLILVFFLVLHTIQNLNTSYSSFVSSRPSSKVVTNNHRSKSVTKNTSSATTMTAATIAERHFIFGYGSLICHRSRAITAPSLASKPAIPVVVEHFARTWTARIPHSKQKKEVYDQATRKRQESLVEDAGTSGIVVDEEGMMNQIHGQTAMGIEYAKNKNCSGVLIEVDNVELEYFDKREGGYDRVEIDLLHVWGLNDDDDDDDDNQETKVGGDEVHHEILQHAFQKRLYSSSSSFSSTDENDEAGDTDSESFKVWVYVPTTPIPANRNYPIMQSYVDIILRGCLDYDQNFLIKFLTTTHGWWHHENHHPNIDGSSILKEEEEEEKGENDQHHYTWVEDRNDPFYVRADSAWSKEKGTLVDEYLQDHLPLAFTKRKSLDKVLGAMEKYEDEFD